MPLPAVVIESLLPMPPGSDRLNEEVTLRNVSGTAVLLDGWFLQDRDGRVWSLASLGELASGTSVTIRRNGMPMNLNDSGDEILLINAGSIEDRFEYLGSTFDEVIVTGH